MFAELWECGDASGEVACVSELLVSTSGEENH